MNRPFFLFFLIGLVLAFLYAYFLSIYYGFSNPLDYLSSVEIGKFHFWLMVAPTIAIWAIFVLISDTKLKSNYGDSKWAKRKDIKKMQLLEDTGPILAMWKGKFIRYNSPLSVLIAAPPGTGKTTAIAIPTLLSCDYSFIVNDIKTELWQLTSGHRSKYQKVFKFAPSEEGAAKWNPFDELPQENLGEQLKFINRIANILYPLSENKKDNHWQNGAIYIFTFFSVITLVDNNKLSMQSIRSKILNTDDIQKFVSDYIDDYEITNSILDGYIKEASHQIMQINEKEFGSMISSTTNPLNSWQNPIIQNNTSESDFSINDLRNPDKKITIYLCSKKDDFDLDQPILRLFLDLAGSKILSDVNVSNNQIVGFLLDEFAQMGKLSNLMALPAVSRGQKAFGIYIVQDYSQLRKVYGDDGIEELITTTAYKGVFTQNNDKAQDRFSKIIGKHTIKKVSISQNSGLKSAGKNKSISEEGQALILPQDIGSLTDNQVIIIAQGYNTRPIMAKTCKYYEIPDMNKLVNAG